MKPEIYNAYVKILHEELVPAMGCTEPIAIAYASALARDTLGTMPERMEVQASGNLIKNVKSVVVPNTNGLKGIEAAVAAGVVAGDAGKALEVISVVSGEQKARIQDMVGRGMCKVSLLDSGLVLDLIVTLHAGDDWARVRIVNHHTDVVLIEKNGAVEKAGGHLQLHRRGLPREAAAHHPGHRGVCPDRGPGRRAGRARAPGEL